MVALVRCDSSGPCVAEEGFRSDWALRAGQEVFAKEIESCGFKKVEEAKFTKEQYFSRFEQVRAKEGTQPKKGGKA